MFDRIFSATFAILFLALACGIVYCIFGLLAEAKPNCVPVAIIFGQLLIVCGTAAYFQARAVFYPAD